MSRLREWRERKGLSQEQLAKLVDADQSQIQRLEKGKTQMTESWMKRLARGLGIRAADLIEEDDTVSSLDMKINLTAMRAIHAELERRDSYLDPDDLAKVLAVVYNHLAQEPEPERAGHARRAASMAIDFNAERLKRRRVS